MPGPMPQSQSDEPIRVLAVTRKPESASFEQRVLNYIEPLEAQHITVDWQRLPDGVFKQNRFLGKLDSFDVVWWHRHLLYPLWLPALCRHARRIAFDFDDPVTHSGTRGGRQSLSRRIRFAALLRRCDAALTASTYLAEMARRHCGTVFIVPMAIDAPASVVQVSRRPGPLQLLWLGSRATQPYLALIAPALAEVGKRHPEATLRLVAHEPMEFGPLRVDHRTWSPQEQEAALRQCHVGLCPMPDTVWTRGKCPYKVLQYMAYGLPWIGSALGENLSMAGDGQRGLCADGAEHWIAGIDRLIADQQRRQEMGNAGRAFVLEQHTRESLAPRLGRVLRMVAGGSANVAPPAT